MKKSRFCIIKWIIAVCVIVSTVLLFHLFDVDDGKKLVSNEYFFPGEGDYYYTLYNALNPYDNESISDTFTISCKRINSFDEGDLYELEFAGPNDFAGRYYHNWDRYKLGLFYVTEDSIIMLRSEPTGVLNRANMFDNGTIVYLSGGKSDCFNESEEAVHEYIEDNGLISTYCYYDSTIETGYYEIQTWHKNKGLVFFAGGWGALRDHIELKMIDYHTEPFIPETRDKPAAFLLMRERGL